MASQEREEAAFAGDAWVWKRLFELGGSHLLGDPDWRWDAAAGVLRP